MKVTLLGSGSSGGVPFIGCECPVCTSSDPKNTRGRVSILVEQGENRILVDTSPDLRQQALQNGFTSVDAILYTHAHADHTHGIDEVRSFNYHKNGIIPVYGDKAALDEIQKRFDYAFLPPMLDYGWFRACLTAHEIMPYKPFEVAGIEVKPFAQKHGKVNSMGFRFGDIAYSTDVKHLSEEAFEVLEGVKTWIVDCLCIEPKPTHAHLDLALEWIARVKPERAILTHMSHDFEYNALKAKLPDGVVPGYDGMVLEV